MNTLIEKLVLLDIDTVDKVVVNNLVDECSNIIRNAAVDSELLSETVVRNRPNVNRKCRVNKPWFNRDCYEKRKLYHIAKNLKWRVHNAESKNNLLMCSKAYRKVLNTQHNLYHKGFIKRLRGLRHNDSKSYWSLLNKAVSSNDKQKIIDKVSIHCFVDHFKKLNTVNVENVHDGFLKLLIQILLQV